MNIFDLQKFSDPVTFVTASSLTTTYSVVMEISPDETLTGTPGLLSVYDKFYISKIQEALPYNSTTKKIDVASATEKHIQFTGIVDGAVTIGGDSASVANVMLTMSPEFEDEFNNKVSNDDLETAISDLHGQIDTFENDISDLRGQIDTFDNDISDLRGQIDTFENDISELQTLLDDKLSSGDVQDIIDNLPSKDDIDDINNSLQDAVVQLGDELKDELQQMNDEFNDSISDLESNFARSIQSCANDVGFDSDGNLVLLFGSGRRVTIVSTAVAGISNNNEDGGD